ncbi:hypothetical protein [Kaistella jeonii]|uniref:HNH endonuclease n=1 Tax=Kaistella jeonii TaxID=266749 RepID=A0A0C1D6S6_9FLAO|nr:hypothetical protein [Kaistella jeonii]KIA89595.1 hypothetical protein OA86_02885 [Kaistella jeonii]SFB90274.1 hypothetical protein SAMN05421876_103323 [Kaistella jeonii]VEI95804.1 Uncharacterised protein [Kaistella jeonii]
MNISQLLDLKTSDHITYQDLLNCDEWKNKREEILDRDNHLCTICKTSKTLDGTFLTGYSKNILYARRMNGELSLPDFRIHLEVHHEFYIRNLFPWEYDDALITVCNECHAAIHQERKIPVYFDQSKTIAVNEDPCQKCGGLGFLDMFAHVQNGICFQCHGTGIQTFWSPNKKEKKFTWQFLYEYRTAFNYLFSGNYSFSEKQLIDFKNYLELGNEHYEINSVISKELKLGLIFNTNICWTDYLEILFYNKPQIIYTGDGIDIYDYQIDFAKLPIDKTVELFKNKDYQESLFIKLYEAIESDTDSQHITVEFERNQKYYNLLREKTNYSADEIFHIMSGEERLHYFNENFYNIVFEKITNDIPNFTIEKFYGLFAKRTANQT